MLVCVPKRLKYFGKLSPAVPQEFRGAGRWVASHRPSFFTGALKRLRRAPEGGGGVLRLADLLVWPYSTLQSQRPRVRRSKPKSHAE